MAYELRVNPTKILGEIYYGWDRYAEGEYVCDYPNRLITQILCANPQMLQLEKLRTGYHRIDGVPYNYRLSYKEEPIAYSKTFWNLRQSLTIYPVIYSIVNGITFPLKGVFEISGYKISSLRRISDLVS